MELKCHQISALAEASCDVVVDFTTAEAARVTLPFLALHGIHAVVGTTGFDDDDMAAFASAFDGSGANCLIAANFAISAVLMMKFAAEAAALFDTAEIIELHHDEKIDAPSGTALATARMMQPGEHGWADDPTQIEDPEGASRRTRPKRSSNSFGENARNDCPPGGHPRRSGADAHHSARLVRPYELHARSRTCM